MSFRFQFRRGTTAERNASNPILAAGEPAVVLDSGQPAELVLGDGVTAMADLRAAVWDDDARLARKSIRDFLKPVQIDSDAATLAQVDDPASFIASPGSVVWDNYAAIGYPAGNPVPVTPGTPHNPGARLQPTGGDNVQSLPFSFYANGKIGIHVTLWADTDIWVSIDGKPISADPFIIKVADTVEFSNTRGWVMICTDFEQADRKKSQFKWLPADTRFEWVKEFCFG